MGGEISLDSTSGRGSTFAFTTRLAVMKIPDLERETPRKSEALDGVSRPLHILLAEDNAVNRRIAVAMLTKAGHRVDVAADGIEAVNAVHHDDFDLVLMDVQMPIMDGVEAARAIRAFSDDKGQIPIIAVTANAMAGDRENYLASGFNDYVSKPFAPAELFDAIARQMAGVSTKPERRASAADPPEDAGDEPAAAIQAR